MDREPAASGLTIVYVLKEALFIDLLVDDKGVIYIPAPELGGVGAVLRAFCSKYSMYRLATMGLTGEPMAAPSTSLFIPAILCFVRSHFLISYHILVFKYLIGFV